MFQTMINTLFKEEINEGHIVVYIDDILIFTNDMISHKKLIYRVLSKLRENKLYLKSEKCEFHKKEVDFLGVIISENSI